MMIRKTVLLVEDDADIRDVLQDLLEDEGFDVVPAGNGHQALEFLRHSRAALPHLVLLDLMMPIIDGQQVLEVMRSQAELAKIPVIVVSALAKPDHPAGVVAFVRKPVSPRSLVELVRASTTLAPATGPD